MGSCGCSCTASMAASRACVLLLLWAVHFTDAQYPTDSASLAINSAYEQNLAAAQEVLDKETTEVQAMASKELGRNLVRESEAIANASTTYEREIQLGRA